MKEQNLTFFNKWSSKRKRGRLLYIFYNSIAVLLLALLLYITYMFLMLGRDYVYNRTFLLRTFCLSILLLVPITLINLRQWNKNEHRYYQILNNKN